VGTIVVRKKGGESGLNRWAEISQEGLRAVGQGRESSVGKGITSFRGLKKGQ